MLVKLLGLVLFALAAPAVASNPSAGEGSPTETSAAQPAAEQNQQAEPQEERLICRRTEHTGQRTASRRVCRTAAQWRALDR